MWLLIVWRLALLVAKRYWIRAFVVQARKSFLDKGIMYIDFRWISELILTCVRVERGERGLRGK